MKQDQSNTRDKDYQDPLSTFGPEISDLLGVPINPHSSTSFPIDKVNSELIKAGASLHWLHVREKRPVADGWSMLPNQSESALRRSYLDGQNIGVRLGEPSNIDGQFLYLVDLDIRDASKAGEAWAALLSLWPAVKCFPSVVSGSGGESRHIYFLSPRAMPKKNLAKSAEFITIRGERKRAWEIDLMGTGSQAVLSPSIHPDTGLPYRWERPVELDFTMWIDGQTLARFPVDNCIGESKPVSRLDHVNPDHLKIAFEFYNVDDREDWLSLAMAIHHQYEGSPKGYSIWNDWAQESAKHCEKDSRTVWKSLKAHKGKLISLRKIFNTAGIDGYQTVFGPDDFDDLPALPLPSKPKMKIMLARNGDPKPTLNNAIVFLDRVNRDQGYSIRKNEMTGQEEWRAGPINDADLGSIRVAIEKAGLHTVGADLTAGAVRAVAVNSKYHPIRDWLKSLAHDGKPRLDTWLTVYMGVEATPYSRAVGRAFLIAMVARVMRPGCKHDHVLVLSGGQGIGKSTACQILGGAWAGDNMPSIRDGAKEAGLYLRGHWLVELAELAPSRKAEAEDLKAFLSRCTDEIRAPYARRADILPRQCVFVGTTNETAFLKDATGGRRFWPVTCGAKIDTDALARDREQLFAEALAAFNAGEVWHLTPELERQATVEQESAREEHPWEQPIRRILDGLTEGDGFDQLPKDKVTVSEVLTLLGIPTAQHTSGNARQVGGILRMLGWSRERTRTGKAWVRQ